MILKTGKDMVTFILTKCVSILTEVRNVRMVMLAQIHTRGFNRCINMKLIRKSFVLIILIILTNASMDNFVHLHTVKAKSG